MRIPSILGFPRGRNQNKEKTSSIEVDFSIRHPVIQSVTRGDNKLWLLVRLKVVKPNSRQLADILLLIGIEGYLLGLYLFYHNAVNSKISADYN